MRSELQPNAKPDTTPNRSFEGKEYVDWCAARAKLMRAALQQNDRELLEQTFLSVVKVAGEDKALGLLQDLQIELDRTTGDK